MFPRRLAAATVLILAAVACGGGGSPTPSAEGSDGPRSGTTPLFYWEQPGVEHRSLIPLDEIISGGPPPDGIPPIDTPAFVTPGRATWLAPDEPVQALVIDGDARAYPLQIMIWHEIVNDTVGGVPVAVTYCPLCNSAIVYERTVAGTETTFGTSGRLYKSDLVMYDRATKSLWPQIMGTAVVGPLIGTELTAVPSAVVSFADFRAEHPDGKVLSRETGFSRDYGSTPYAGYDSTDEPFLFNGDVPDALPKIARVTGVRAGGQAKTYPLARLRTLGDVAAVNDEIGGTPVVIFYESGVRSVLDRDAIALSKDVGAAAAFARTAGSRTLTFDVRAGAVHDVQTGSRWNIFGRATSGPLKGTALARVSTVETFWFAWAVFVPDSPIWSP